MLGGQASVPLVIRGPQGGGLRLAAQHSQSLESWFAHIPGLVVIVPSSPRDAKGLLIAAIRDENPVLFLEHKLLYFEPPSTVPEERYQIPIGRADVKVPGTDVTIVALGSMVPRAVSAALDLQREGIQAEVIDPRTVRPLDRETITASVAKTRRLVVVQEGWPEYGFGAEIIASAVEQAGTSLKAAPVRLGAPPTPMPYNDALERASITSRAAIADRVREVMTS
jgi:2-oxoisovalerate dehydrogenase E1 component